MIVLYRAHPGWLGLDRESRDPGETSFREGWLANQSGVGRGTGTRHLTWEKKEGGKADGLKIKRLNNKLVVYRLDNMGGFMNSSIHL